MYAILSHGGRQYRVSAGDRLLVDRLSAEVGSVVALEPVLLTGGDGERTGVGDDVDGMRVAATVVAHRRGRKLRIFKYKAKKRSRKVAGYRSDLTELRVDSILAKGAALPAAASAADGAVQGEERPRARRSGRTPAATAAAEPASTTTGDAEPGAAEPAGDAAPPEAAAPKRAARAAKAPEAGAADAQAGASPKAAKPARARTTKAAKAPEPAGETADGGDGEETGDGA